MTQYREPSDANERSAENWLQDHGDYLFCYALRRVNRRETAEDLVQETLVAAIRAYDSFQGQSSERTWLVSILRNKIIDHIRKKCSEEKLQERLDQEMSTQFFTSRGHWTQKVRAWPTSPQESLQKQEFWKTLENCCMKLPNSIGVVFRLRELEDLSTKEICKLLSITSTNLSVRLHRARLMIRECLEKNWFQKDK